MNLKKLIPIIILLFAFSANAQISKVQYQQIDSLFTEWNKSNHPGGAIGIMQNGKTVFLKAYGLASMEYLVPNTIGTLFNTGSVSKQFTAMGIVLLQQQGKLSFDDDIRKYLPELPDFGETISIRHMLHHTSGLRSLHAMLGLAGWRGDDSRTNEDLNRFMNKQQDLNFKPGDEYLYCNTGYMLMVNIIERVTGEKFPKWMKNNVFEPLGMTNTYVEDNYNRIVLNNATSYYKDESNDFNRSVEYWGYIGSGNMHSTVEDILIWLNNFSEPSLNWERAFKMLQTTDKLNDGSKNNYAFGVTVDEVKGLKRIQHGGAIGGFRSFVSAYPEEQLSIAVLTNFSSSDSRQKKAQIAAVLLKKYDKEIAVKEKTTEDLRANQLSNEKLKSFEASYWNDKDNYARKIYLKNDTLRYSRSATNESPIVPIGNDSFQMLKVSADLKVKFEINGKGKSMIVTVNHGQPSLFQGFEPTLRTKKELASYSGKFYSPELETTYDIYLKNDTLFYHNARHGDFKMKVLKKDVLEGEWPLNIAKFQRDEKGNINGILVSNGRVRNLWFEKQQ